MSDISIYIAYNFGEGKLLCKRWRGDGLKKTEMVSDSMEGRSVADKALQSFTLQLSSLMTATNRGSVDNSSAFVCCCHPCDGMEDSTVNCCGAIPYTTLMSFTLFSTLPNLGRKFELSYLSKGTKDHLFAQD